MIFIFLRRLSPRARLITGVALIAAGLAVVGVSFVVAGLLIHGVILALIGVALYVSSLRATRRELRDAARGPAVDAGVAGVAAEAGIATDGQVTGAGSVHDR